jgi:hypothetical protein
MPDVRLIKHETVPKCGSYEVRIDGKRSRFFYFENDPGRRLRPEVMTREEALELARSLARSEHAPMMASKPLDVPMDVAEAFAKDMRAYHAERDPMKRAEIAQRQLDALQRFQGPRDTPLRFRDIIEMFEEMKD